MANPDNRLPHVFARDGVRSYPAAVREQTEGRLPRRCRQRTRRHCNNRIESDHRHIKRRLRPMQGPRTAETAWAVIQGIEATQMIRKGQVLGIARRNLHGQAGSSAPYWLLHSRRSRTLLSCAIQCADATLPSIQVLVLASNLYIGLVDPIALVGRFGCGRQRLLSSGA